MYLYKNEPEEIKLVGGVGHKRTMSVFLKPQKVEGFVLTEGYLKDRRLLDDYEVNEEDVWIAGAPKSGTTWTQEMVWLMVNDLDYEGAKVSIQERTPHWEHFMVMDLRPLGAKQNVEIPLFRADALRFIKENRVKGKPMCIKTHMAFNLLPRQIKDGIKKPKIVYVARNPKDICVSLYHYIRNTVGFDGTLEDLAEQSLANEVIYGPAWDHTISYWKERHRSNLLILRYEEMVEDLPAVLRKVSDFLGKTYTEEQFVKLADHLSFEKMRNNPAVSFKNIFALMTKLGFKNEGGAFMRSGKVGSFKEVLSPETIAKFDQLLLEKTKESGWNFI